MPRLQTIDPVSATGRAKELLDGVQKKMGMIPNLMRTLASSPAALKAYLDFNDALASGRLDPQLRERFSIAVASANNCGYCLSAHTALGRLAGLSPEELAAAQHGESNDERARAALRFGTKLVRERGLVTDKDVAEIRRAGFDDGEIAEIVATVALNIFTNYFNQVAETEVDFPPVKAAAVQPGTRLA